MGPLDFLGMDPPNFLGMGPPAGAAFEAGGTRGCVPPRLQERNGDVNQGDVLFGGGPEPQTRGARSWRPRLLRRPAAQQAHPVTGFGPLTQQSAYRGAFFRTGERDGAEGIDNAEI